MLSAYSANSSLQFGVAASFLGSANAITKESTQAQANSIPQNALNSDSMPSDKIAENSSEKNTSSLSSLNSLSSGVLNGFSKSIIKAALAKIEEIKSEMAEFWLRSNGKEIGIGVRNSEVRNLGADSIESSLKTSGFDLLDSMNSFGIGAQKELANGAITLTQGFFGSLSIEMKANVFGANGSKSEISISINAAQSFMQNISIGANSANSANSANNLAFNSSANVNINATGSALWGGASSTNWSGDASSAKVIDPLVIDFDGDASGLSGQKFSFDLDADGKEDQISMLKKGSGFLALDKNNDGKINDGSELFGALNGDGFADLAQYDDNKDGKIDKNDEIYNKLRIWSPDENGEGKLVGLGEKGIGAIFLNAQEQKEMLNSENGELLGIRQKSANFLRNDGSLGNISHIDFVAQDLNSATNLKRENFIESKKSDSMKDLNESKTSQNLANSAFIESFSQNINFGNINISNINALNFSLNWLNSNSIESSKDPLSSAVKNAWQDFIKSIESSTNNSANSANGASFGAIFKETLKINSSSFFSFSTSAMAIAANRLIA